MLKVKDTNGNPLNGHFRGSNGSIVVHDQNEYQRYKIEKQQKIDQKQKIESLEDEIQQLKQMLLQMASEKK